jgi:hypothetical protein
MGVHGEFFPTLLKPRCADSHQRLSDTRDRVYQWALIWHRVVRDVNFVVASVAISDANPIAKPPIDESTEMEAVGLPTDWTALRP